MYCMDLYSKKMHVKIGKYDWSYRSLTRDQIQPCIEAF